MDSIILKSLFWTFCVYRVVNFHNFIRLFPHYCDFHKEAQSEFHVNQNMSFQSLTHPTQPGYIWLVLWSCWEHLDLRMHWEKDARQVYWRHSYMHKHLVNTLAVHPDRKPTKGHKVVSNSLWNPSLFGADSSLPNVKSLKRSLINAKAESTNQDGAPPEYLLPGSSERPLMALLPHSSQQEVCWYQESVWALG